MHRDPPRRSSDLRMKKNRVFFRGPVSKPGMADVPTKPWPCATCVTVKSAVTALSHPRLRPAPNEAASTLVNVPKDGARCKPDRVLQPEGPATIFFSAVAPPWAQHRRRLY